MPIRFRCAYCNQLMGIGRRKSGTVVRCPRCAGEVIVPAEQEPQAANGSGSGRFNQLLESEDFAKEFADVKAVQEEMPNPLMPPPAYAHTPLATAESRAAESRAAPPQTDGALRRSLTRSGIFLTMPMLIGAGVLLLAAIGLTFLLGFFLGRSTL